VRDQQDIEERLPLLRQQASQSAERLFAAYDDGDLRKLGIDDQVLEFARALTGMEQLEAARASLPEAQYTLLLGLALGYSPEDVWAEVSVGLLAATGTPYDPDDIAGAVGGSGERVVVVTGPDELMEVFSYPFAQWRVFLHPSQRRAAYGSFSGSARVTGGPGTGKTVVVLHRVGHLARQAEGDRSVLLTTFTTTLARSLEDSLRILVEDEAMLRRIDVRNLDQVAYRFVAQHHGRPRIIAKPEERARWRALAARHEVDATDAFLAQEWREVVLAQEVQDLDGYLSASRRGRGVPMGRKQREELWPVMRDFADELQSSRQWTHETICVEAARLASQNADPAYQHVLVDEAQDLSPWQWRLIRALTPRRADDVFIAGDTHQRIYSHRASLRRLGIDVTGRSTRLKINYRTTAEILGWSFGILTGEAFDDLNDGLETLAGCRSEIHGPAPRMCPEADEQGERRRLVQTVRQWLDEGVPPDEIGVAARTKTLVDDAVAALRSAAIDACPLVEADGGVGNSVQVGTMHRMKGLEFRGVVIIGANAAQLPSPSAVTPATEDRTTHDLDLQRERCLLFVACTRAREQLAVIWHGQPSTLLPAPPDVGVAEAAK
jgi:superfamily I DNA/RNA helicase